jgi:parafibromin
VELHIQLNADINYVSFQREDVPVVRRPDRKELLAYLKGTDSQIPKSIDKSARLEMPSHVKRSAEDKLESTAAKKARMDGGQVGI